MRWAAFTSALIAFACNFSVGSAAADTGPLRSILGPADDHGTLYLARPDPTPPDRYPTPLLIRELERQALLLCARDEMGLYTRDEVLREFDARDSNAPPALRVSFDFDPEVGTFRSHTAWTRDPASNGSADGTLPQLPGDTLPDVALSLRVAEATSRTSWRRVLEKAGYQVGLVRDDPDAPAPDGVEPLLYQTTPFAPFAAVQRTHAMIREKGESQARLSALARGYANLGLLTRFHWSTDHQVFAARSLLYGQRMVVRWPRSALSYWSLAYAEAQAGMHNAALVELTRATRIQATGGDAGRAVPPWVELIRPVCEYDLAKLTSAIAADAAQPQLAALCAFGSVEQCGSHALVLEVGDATLRFNPACFAIMDGMYTAAGVAPGARLTALAPFALARSLPDDLALMPNGPAGTGAPVKALASAAGRADAELDVGAAGIAPEDRLVADTASALVGASSTRCEPSFVAAGRLIQETTFVHVARRAEFITERWGWDGSDYVAAARPLVAEHPLRQFVWAYGLNAPDRPNALRSLVVDEAQRNMWELTELVENVEPPAGEVAGSKLRTRAFRDLDATAYWLTDLLVPFSAGPGGSDMGLIGAMKDFDAKSPMLEAARVRDHWALPDVKAEARNWMRDFGQQPATLRALAGQLLNDGDRGQAEAVLEQYAKIAGDYREASQLAGLYLADGDEARWLSTLEAAVKRPDAGLDHAQARVAIARHFMAKGDYRRALPYADAAEETQAFWAMKCDADCHRALGDTATADRIMQAAREHYGHD
jgi:hypothetical protein